MLKVQFKKDCKKIQAFNNRCTIVTLVGQMSIPNNLWAAFPNEVANWIWEHPSVDASWGTCSKIRLEFSGKSVCAKEDTFNAVTGERIAEARAKIKLYKFMRTLCLKLHDAYSILLTSTDVNAFDHNPKKPSINRSYFRYCELLSKERHHLIELLQQT